MVIEVAPMAKMPAHLVHRLPLPISAEGPASMMSWMTPIPLFDRYVPTVPGVDASRIDTGRSQLGRSSGHAAGDPLPAAAFFTRLGRARH